MVVVVMMVMMMFEAEPTASWTQSFSLRKMRGGEVLGK
jgi:hypothetical protein